MNVAKMNKLLQEKFDEAVAKFPDVPKDVIWKGVKAAILAAEVAKGLQAEGKQLGPDALALIFTECVKHTDKA